MSISKTNCTVLFVLIASTAVLHSCDDGESADDVNYADADGDTYLENIDDDVLVGLIEDRGYTVYSSDDAPDLEKIKSTLLIARQVLVNDVALSSDSCLQADREAALAGITDALRTLPTD